jgi:hypothetical protein
MTNDHSDTSRNQGSVPLSNQGGKELKREENKHEEQKGPV